MVVRCCVSSALHPDILQAPFPLSFDGDLVNLVLGLVVRGIPCGLVDFLVGEYRASNDQVVEGAEFSEKFSIFVDAQHYRMETFLPFELNRTVSILHDTGSQDSSVSVVSGVISSATPCMYPWPSSCPEYMMVSVSIRQPCPSNSCPSGLAKAKDLQVVSVHLSTHLCTLSRLV